jgi:hypothetical protein
MKTESVNETDLAERMMSLATALAAAEACRHLKQGGVFLARLADLSAAALVAIGDVMGRYGFAAIPEPGNLLCCRRLAAPLN